VPVVGVTDITAFTTPESRQQGNDHRILVNDSFIGSRLHRDPCGAVWTVLDPINPDLRVSTSGGRNDVRPHTDRTGHQQARDGEHPQYFSSYLLHDDSLLRGQIPSLQLYSLPNMNAAIARFLITPVCQDLVQDLGCDCGYAIWYVRCAHTRDEKECKVGALVVVVAFRVSVPELVLISVGTTGAVIQRYTMAGQTTRRTGMSTKRWSWSVKAVEVTISGNAVTLGPGACRLRRFE
jgi:hypothetical protein